MNESEIESEIERTVAGTSYPRWTIGVTDDPDRRGAEHESPRFWHQWKADADTIARSVEKYFLDKGMKDAPSSGEHPSYVYVF
jgi:hypothetical protein